MNEMKETKELLKGLLLVAAMMAQEFKDGAQIQDIEHIFAKIRSNEALKQAMLDAYNDMDKVPEELKDVGAMEAISLLAASAPEFVQLIEAIRGKA